MNDAYNFTDAIIENKLLELHTAMPCKVNKMNNDGTSDVVPIFMRKFKGQANPQPLPLLLNVPILKRKYRTLVEGEYQYQTDEQYFEKGDIVLVVFSERAMDKVKTKQIHYPEFYRKHSLEDGVILGLLY